MNFLTNMIPTILQSSENNGTMSMTIKGVALIALTYALTRYGITVDKGVVMDIVNQTATLIGMVMTLYGIVRKVMNNQK